MSSNPLKLKIAYLLPDVLESFCDEANVKAFLWRANLRGIDVQIYNVLEHEKIQSTKYDFYYIGGSNSENLEKALLSLKTNKDELHIASSAGIPMLAVNCGYQLFGNFYQLHNKTRLEGLKLLDVDSIASKKPFFGPVTGICNFLKNKTIAGFENHSIKTYLRPSAAPFLTIKKGLGNNAEDKTEGARNNNVIGTYLTSALLPQNPHFCDFLIAVALRIKYKCKVPLTPLCDDIEWYSHNYIVENS